MAKSPKSPGKNQWKIQLKPALSFDEDTGPGHVGRGALPGTAVHGERRAADGQVRRPVERRNSILVERLSPKMGKSVENPEETMVLHVFTVFYWFSMVFNGF